MAGCKSSLPEALPEVPLPTGPITLSLTMTDEAAEHICNAMRDAKGPAKGVRVSVQRAGCSGYEYTLEYAYEILPMDYSVMKNGAWVVIDRAILAKFMNNSIVEYRKEGVNEGLVFNNPRAVATCGCGESFTLGK